MILLALVLGLIAGLSFIFTRKNIFWLVFKSYFITIAVLAVFLFGIRWLQSDIQLTKSDFYGTYRINRDYFPGEDAEWQYEHFKFEILENDSIHFYVTNNDSVVRVYKGKVFFNESYKSVRIRFDMLSPVHHVMSEQPLITRSRWDFDIVMHSPLYSNMYFEKTSW